MSSQLRSQPQPCHNHATINGCGLTIGSIDDPEPLLIDVPDTDDAPLATAGCVASSDEVDSTLGCPVSGGVSKRFRKDLPAVGNEGRGGPDSRCSEVSSESSLHNNIFEYFSGLAPSSADTAATAVTRTVLHVTETYQSGLLTNANTIVIDDGEDQYEASYDIQASVDENGFIDVPVDFAPKLLDQDCGDIFDISDQNFTISKRAQQQQQQPESSARSTACLSAWAAEAARADADIAYLRRAAFRLVCALLPQLELRSEFDCSTRSTDRLLLALCSILDDSRSAVDQCRAEFDKRIRRKLLRKRSRRLPTVSLCSHPAGCAAGLRRRILRLLRLLLPQLQLPDCLQSAMLTDDSRSSPGASLLVSLLIDRVVKHSKRR
ncbi:hypothetical protein BOX15_Mlig000819g1 [Macrostomum lignano]|uniref:Uncharacterized protein n=1 Tax=Macrostomum lignano TaxID=282301 RepID=A0A267GI91_9PLAT|nr:hypothetical protein BOX15_Mlig000819g1 [Macrostomum lignano]